jgi:N,N-dimethylformamidase beta subunit-like, C-terminal
VTVVLVAAVASGLTACAAGARTAPADGAAAPDDAGAALTGRLPVLATQIPSHRPGSGRGGATSASSGGTAFTRAARSGAATAAAIPTAATFAPMAGLATTPGRASVASQPIGHGYVDTLAENRLPGTPGWRSTASGQSGQHPGKYGKYGKLAKSGRPALIEGYADTTSTLAGQPVRLFVSSSARTFRIQLLRLGWYGGVGARQVWMSVPVAGGIQSGPHQDRVTRLITTDWRVSAVLPTGGLVAGDYVAKLLGSDGAASFVPLAVREPQSTGAVLLLNSTLTWLAYNPWGGANTYSADEATSATEGYDKRSVVTSFDRPYAKGAGTGGLLDEEYNLVLVAERLGLRLNYASDLDLHSDPGVLTGATGVVLLGHSEYWSRAMRDALTRARDAGTNLAFLGANDVYRRIRLEASPVGPLRQMINYKDGRQDPVKTVDTTADWPYLPFENPESSLTGVQYRCARADAAMVVTDPNGWLFRGLGLRTGQRLPGLVGTEFDRVSLGGPTPRPIQVMAHSPVSCYGYPEYSDLVWYTTPSGAGVFAAGTLGWDRGISSPDPMVRTVVTTVTERVFRAMAEPLAGWRTPALDNALRFYSPSGVPLTATGQLPAHPRTNVPRPTAG